jgi:hypothetical protein
MSEISGVLKTEGNPQTNYSSSSLSLSLFFFFALTTEQNVTACWYPAFIIARISSYAEISHCADEHLCSFYSRIPLIWHAWDGTGAGLSNIVDCQAVSIPKSCK